MATVLWYPLNVHPLPWSISTHISYSLIKNFKHRQVSTQRTLAFNHCETSYAPISLPPGKGQRNSVDGYCSRHITRDTVSSEKLCTLWSLNRSHYRRISHGIVYFSLNWWYSKMIRVHDCNFLADRFSRLRVRVSRRRKITIRSTSSCRNSPGKSFARINEAASLGFHRDIINFCGWSVKVTWNCCGSRSMMVAACNLWLF